MIRRIQHGSAAVALFTLLVFTCSWFGSTVHLLYAHHDHSHEVPDCDTHCDSAVPHLHNAKVHHDDHCKVCTLWHAAPVVLPSLEFVPLAAEYGLKGLLLYQAPSARFAGSAAASRGPPAAHLF